MGDPQQTSGGSRLRNFQARDRGCAHCAGWEEGFLFFLKEYVEENGHAKPATFPHIHVGFNLGNWVTTQRLALVFAERRAKAEKLQDLPGWTLNTLTDKWEMSFRHLEEYVAKHGDANVPPGLLLSGRVWAG